jgi:hypothetical protein
VALDFRKERMKKTCVKWLFERINSVWVVCLSKGGKVSFAQLSLLQLCAIAYWSRLDEEGDVWPTWRRIFRR